MPEPKFKDLTALVWDNFLFAHTAIKLSETFGRVLYGGPNINAFPKSNLDLPGDGIDGITRIKDFDDHVDKADLIVFPDVMFGATAVRLREQGKRVWGPGRGENLELDRWKSKKLFKQWGMPVAESHLIEGMPALRRFLQERQGHWWIKTSRYRGDFETFDIEDYDDGKVVLDKRESELGAKAEVYPFIVEKHIEAILEIGYDGYTIDGQFQKPNDMAMFGCEKKDLGYVGVAKKYGDLPEMAKWVNEKLAPYLKQNQYRGFFSSEIRCTEEDQFEAGDPKPFEDFDMIFNHGTTVPGTKMFAFCTDPCCRMASPPGEAYIEWLDNWPEIIWQGANGIFVPPSPVAKYAVEIMLHSQWADQNWQPVRFPKTLRRWVKLRNHCRIQGLDYAVPQSVGLPEIGAVIGLDDDLVEAARLALERSQEVKGYFIEPKVDAIAKTIIEIHNAQEQGIIFTDEPLPTAEVLEELQPTE